jgi:hypothetical protein
MTVCNNGISLAVYSTKTRKNQGQIPILSRYDLRLPFEIGKCTLRYNDLTHSVFSLHAYTNLCALPCILWIEPEPCPCSSGTNVDDTLSAEHDMPDHSSSCDNALAFGEHLFFPA